jgi:hypothetical protein
LESVRNSLRIGREVVVDIAPIASAAYIQVSVIVHATVETGKDAYFMADHGVFICIP